MSEPIKQLHATEQRWDATRADRIKNCEHVLVLPVSRKRQVFVSIPVDGFSEREWEQLRRLLSVMRPALVRQKDARDE